MMSRRVVLSMLMFVSLVGVLQTEALAQTPPNNGKVTVSQVTYAASTDVNKFFHVELYYETGQYNMETGEYGIQRSELHQG